MCESMSAVMINSCHRRIRTCPYSPEVTNIYTACAIRAQVWNRETWNGSQLAGPWNCPCSQVTPPLCSTCLLSGQPWAAKCHSSPAREKRAAQKWNGEAEIKRKRKSSILLIVSAVFKQKVQPQELFGVVCQHCSTCDRKLSSHLLTHLLVKIYVSIHSYNLILLLKNKMQDCPLYF